MSMQLAKLMLPHLKALVDLCEQAVKGEALELRTHAMTGTRKNKYIKNLRKSILALLKERPNLTSGEVADALYSEDMGISSDLFRRRVIVHLSSMYKRGVLWVHHPSGSVERRYLTSAKE